jgi:hypothetical protein
MATGGHDKMIDDAVGLNAVIFRFMKRVIRITGALTMPLFHQLK